MSELRSSRWNARDAAFVGASIALFLGRFLIGWDAHQAPHPDEAEILVPIWGFLTQNRALLGHAVTANLWGFRIPLMNPTPYFPPYDGILSIPFLLLWGNTMRALVFRNAFFGSLAVAALYRLSMILFGRRSCALAAALLLANAAWFILACRLGVFSSISSVALGLLALADLAAWLEDGSPWAAVRAFSCLGLGSCCCPWFWGLLPGLAVCALVYRGRVQAARRRSRSLRPGFELLCGGAFLIWTTPVAIANAIDGWQTVRFALSCFQRHGSDSLFNGAALVQRFNGRVWQLLHIETGWDWTRLLTGGFSGLPRWFLGAPTALVCLALALEAGASSLSIGRRAGKCFAALFLIVAIHVLLSLLSPNDFIPVHLYPIMPIFYLCAAALPCFWPGRGRRLAWLVTAAVLAASAIQSRAVLADVHRGLDRTGGIGVESSSAVVDLTRWLKDRPADKPVFLQYRNFANTVLFLGGGAVDPQVFGWDDATNDFQDPAGLIRAARSEKSDLFITSYCHEPCSFADQAGKPKMRDEFQKAVGKRGWKLREVKTFLSRDGQVVYDAYRVSPD